MSPRALRSLRSLVLAALTAASLGLSARVGQAASIGVVFDGPTSSTGQHWGLSSSEAAAAQAAGVDVVTPPMYDPGGVLSIVDQDLSSRSYDPNDLHTPFEIGSRWTTESDLDLSGYIVYLVFTTVDARTLTLGSQTLNVDYDEDKVGLRLDPTTGWVLLRTSAPSLGTLYYPAIPLGPLALAQQKAVDVKYYLEQLITYESGGNTYVPLPKLRIQVAIAPIPEPGTALLLALGLCGLAARARARR
jgi:hypothetical protein